MDTIKHGQVVMGKSIPTQLTQHIWLSLPFELRQELIEVFTIPKSGVVQVEYAATPIVKSDGHTFEDLSAVSIEKMQTFTGSTEPNFHTLFDLTLDKIATKQEAATAEAKVKLEELEIKKEAAAQEQAVEALTEVAKVAQEVLQKKRGRPAKVK